MLNYSNIIEKCAKERINRRIPNGQPVNAEVLLSTMFRYASSEIRIYSGGLNDRVYGTDGLIESASKFLSDPYSTLQILLQTSMTPHDFESLRLGQLINSLRDKERHGCVEVRNAIGNYASSAAKHFATMDYTGFRYEFNHQACEAIANFNEPDTADKLNRAFDRAFKLSGTPNRVLEIGRCL
ncbi:hypothetical protein [Candidatus Thiodiazotropha sp. LNASS1]|uniref:DUF7931 domain-containing protein n=1 Tax=Candidatus Thiodiazotropha sp. LNASS1 TaxID=3096260 RepID=UPI0034DFFCE3